MMTTSDIIIIYLALGSPFGVYIYFQNPKKCSPQKHLFQTALIFAFWLPFAITFLVKKKFVWFFSNDDFNKQQKLRKVQKQFEEILSVSKFDWSLYDFREIFERYVGLTTALKKDGAGTSSTETELLTISDSNNVEIGGKCLYRRNRTRLIFHHKLARREFLILIKRLSANESTYESLGETAFKLVTILEDRQARNALEDLFRQAPQIENEAAVSNTEINLWKPEPHKHLTAKPISTHLETMTATPNLHVKD